MQRRAFTAIEALMTIGIIAVTTTVTVPVYRNYQIRSELMDATEQILTAMRVAQLKARAGETAGTWGVETARGVLFQGDSFAERDPAHDESYPLPPSVVVSGLSEVVFLPLSGLPSVEGEVLLTASNGDSRTIIVGEQGTVSASGLSVPSIFSGGGSASSASSSARSSSVASTASSVVSQGSSVSSPVSSVSSAVSSAPLSLSSSAPSSTAVSVTSSSPASSVGVPGGGQSSSSSSSAISSPSSSPSSVSSPSSTGLPTCEDRFFIGPDGTLQTTGKVRATFTVLGSEITYGLGGPEVDVTVQASTDGGSTWVDLFGAADVDGGEEQTITNLASGAKIAVRVSGKYSWLFSRSYLSNDGRGQVVVLKNGSKLPDYPTFGNQANLSSYLRAIVSNGRIAVGQYDAVFLAELGTLNSSSADFQDLVLLVRFAQETGSCTSSTSSSTSRSSSSTSVASSTASSGGSSILSSSSRSSSAMSSSSSSDSGKKITICHFASDKGNTLQVSESAWPAHAAHGDRKGECKGDDDGDEIDNADDFCPGTKVEKPKKYLLFFRNALTQEYSDIFRVGPTQKISSFTLADTGGCSCEQLLDIAEGKSGYYFYNVPSTYLSLRNLLDGYVSTARKYGCSNDLLDFVEKGVKDKKDK